MGNVVNRVFDSSGPEGKVRGTPQQIIDKYQQLHRDAQLSNDRVAAENFKQHAEHYARLLGVAMKEQEARREAEQQRQREREDQRNNDRQPRDQSQEEQPAVAPVTSSISDDVVDLSDNSDSGLVETVESGSPVEQEKPRRSRSRKPRKPQENSAPEDQSGTEAAE